MLYVLKLLLKLALILFTTSGYVGHVINPLRTKNRKIYSQKEPTDYD